jgi:hypothetical protein
MRGKHCKKGNAPKHTHNLIIGEKNRQTAAGRSKNMLDRRGLGSRRRRQNFFIRIRNGKRIGGSRSPSSRSGKKADAAGETVVQEKKEKPPPGTKTRCPAQSPAGRKACRFHHGKHPRKTSHAGPKDCSGGKSGSRDSPPFRRAVWRNGFQAGRFSAAGSQSLQTTSRSAIAASSDFFALAHAGAVAPFTS